MVLKNIPVVAFLTIYPKRGPMQKIDLEENDLSELIKVFATESIAHQIVIHDIANNLKEMVLTKE